MFKKLFLHFHLILKCFIIQTDKVQFIAAMTYPINIRIHFPDHFILWSLCIFQFDDLLRLSTHKSCIIHYTSRPLHIADQYHNSKE